MRRGHLVLLLGLTLGSIDCAAEEAGGLWIQDVIAAFPPACTIEPRSTFVNTVGLLDLVHPNDDPSQATNIMAVPYYAPLRIHNFLVDQQRKPTLRLGNEGPDMMPLYFRVNIIGYDICVSPTQDDDPYRRCRDISDALHFFVPTSLGAVQNAPVADVVEVLPADMLLQYFGNNLEAIPLGGVHTLELRITALGIQESGAAVRSNMFRFPIKVCRGCRSCFLRDQRADLDSTCFVFQDNLPSCE